MHPDLWILYRHMLRSRLFEEAVIKLWEEGKISGEMHLGIGEEAINAGIVLQLREGDAMALDHRATAPFLMRGIDPVSLLREFLGRPDGLCSGMGGHMHLFSSPHLSASSGIVGAAGPAAAGFALAAQHLRPGTLAVAFFGEGALNQGMMMESMNLAVIWKLPVLFICKDNEWSLLTRSSSVTGGKIRDRAKALGMRAIEIDGGDVEAIWNAAHEAMERARKRHGPTFLHAHCVHLEGHFLGDPLLLIARHPVKGMMKFTGPMLSSAARKEGASLKERLKSLETVTYLIGKTTRNHRLKPDDPVERTRRRLRCDKNRLKELEKEARQEILQAVEKGLKQPCLATEEGEH